MIVFLKVGFFFGRHSSYLNMKTPLKRIKTTIVIFKTNCTQESIYWHVQSNRFRNKWEKTATGRLKD